MGLHDCSRPGGLAEPPKKGFFVAGFSKAKKSARASLATSNSTQRNKRDNGSMTARLEKSETIFKQLKQLKELMDSEVLNREEFEQQKSVLCKEHL